ncbi:phosphoadenosine phosphosulfate reductase family protein [Geopsychrobacter electrodiphilus]|uniref:phosphoadenosine phosphosulfate reductase domain-containing protein n=1 Tax=Geopsychrobacter electrodiphilus TaxID=225196 RepID=UPI00036C4EE7|nr:phosphoadenosine phosphosulfate reductase family protein [Geopsychrobacter electrodiphilus]
MGLFEISDEELYQEAVAQPLDYKIAQSLQWIREYEKTALDISPDGYYVAFSGGKDSIVMERLFEMAGVKYEAWYNNVTIDPPELVWFIKDKYPVVRWNNPEKHLIHAMSDKAAGPPTRLIRWCCEVYKEQGGNGKFKAIGVRGEESPRRKATWTFLTSHRKDNSPILCPIIYWSDRDIWEFIRKNKMDYCCLYDEGFKRIGCVGCPMGGPTGMKREFKRWPKYEAMWKRGFQEFWDNYKGVPRRDGNPRSIEKFSTVDDLWDWWISGKAYQGPEQDCQGWLW